MSEPYVPFSRDQQHFVSRPDPYYRYKQIHLNGMQEETLSSGSAEVTQRNNDIELVIIANVPETQMTFTYHSPYENCSCPNNCDWDSKCGCGHLGCQSYQVYIGENHVGPLRKWSDGSFRLVQKLQYYPTGKLMIKYGGKHYQTDVLAGML